MNYYSFHIGDFVAATVHLSAMEELAYRRLLDMYYDTEQPIPLETDRVSRRLRLDSETVDSVLSEFFERTDAGWRNSRCDREIAEYQRKASVARKNGKAGGRPKKTQSVSDGNREKSGSKANQEPITNNQEPVSKQQGADAPAPKVPRFDPRRLDLPAGLSQDKWCEWVSYRSKRRPALTEETAAKQLSLLGSAISDGHSADEMIEASIRNGWQGLFLPKPVQRPPAARSAMNRIGIDSQTPEGWGDGSDL